MQARTPGSRALLAFVAAWLSFPRASDSGAFFIQEQSVKGEGRAFAGQSVDASDPSSLFYNPANAVHVEGIALGIAGYGVAGHLDLDNTGTEVSTPATALAGLPGVPVGGGNGGNPVGVIPLGGLYFSYPLLPERIGIGLGITQPFGLRTSYGDTWFGRYDSIDSRLVTVDIGPALAFALTRSFSIGAGLNVQYADARLENAVPDPLVVPPGPATDGDFTVKGDDWSVGYNVGLRFDPTPALRFGLAYRSRIEHDLEGEAEFARLSGPLAAQNGTTPATAGLHLPDIVLFGAACDWTPRLTLLAQVNWFDWSRFEEIRVQLKDGRSLGSPQDFEDTISAALGIEYRWGSRWSLRAGVQFDPSPVQETLRSTRIPDADRYWASVGFSYRIGPNADVDFGYSHIWGRAEDLDRSDLFFEGTPVQSTTRIRARLHSSVDVVGVQLNYRF